MLVLRPHLASLLHIHALKLALVRKGAVVTSGGSENLFSLPTAPFLARGEQLSLAAVLLNCCFHDGHLVGL